MIEAMTYSCGSLVTEHAAASKLHTHRPWREVGGRRVSWTLCLVWCGSTNNSLFRRDIEGEREIPKGGFWRSPPQILDYTPLLPLRFYHNGVQLLLTCKWKKIKSLDVSDDPPSSKEHWASIMHHAPYWALVNTTGVVSWNPTGRWRHYSRQKQPLESPWNGAEIQLHGSPLLLGLGTGPKEDLNILPEPGLWASMAPRSSELLLHTGLALLLYFFRLWRWESLPLKLLVVTPGWCY